MDGSQCLIKGWEKLPKPLRSGLSNSTLSELSQFPSDWPELELLPLASTTATVTDTDNYFSVSIAVLATTSRGNVTINSTDTNDNPLVSPNWLLTKADQELAVQGFKRAREIAMATGMTIGPETSPGPLTQTDAQILEYIKQDLAPIHHASATCRLSLTGKNHLDHADSSRRNGRQKRFNRSGGYEGEGIWGASTASRGCFNISLATTRASPVDCL